MRGMVPPDPSGSGISQTVYATVYMPKFKPSRNRFPASCITAYASEQEAIEAAEGDSKRFPAVIQGPSKSSEGQYIYYLWKWL
ncbi:hypothetical protein RCF98_04820 [Thiothrix lacustris]|uniref:Uncharacterized protein n=1 Tax=Thiothrix lacustris TaxID=525917 RepID=A0ABY9MSN3_9GAMM|nr:hypothetical protein [Thiothrix lacustris]WML91664.1 hypothetical protein RCF98_04820 [Thiothrix lacustris]